MPESNGIPMAALALAVSLPLSAAIPDDVSLEPAFGGYTFNFPVAVRHAGDGSGRRFVVERGGSIRVVEASDRVLPAPFLDSFDQPVDTRGEGGLLGLAFHPDFSVNGLFYVNYTWHNGSGLITRISEFEVDAGDPNRADPDTERVILEIPQDFTNHNGGDLHFGPDGYLWIGMGDGGNANDPCNRAQTLDPGNLVSDCGSSHPTTEAKALLGKMLRIDVDNTTSAGNNNLCAAAGDGSANYAVPGDNPYVGQGNRCGEVWAYGLRNPYRFSFDRATGDVWIGDVGQGTWEEIDLEPAASIGGINYGWKVCEGEYATGSTSIECPLGGSELPVMSYLNNGNCSVTGGYRYRGPIASLAGQYVFGDYCSGRIWFAEEVAGDWEMLEFDALGFGLVGFGEDETGHLYLTRSDGSVLVFDNRIFADRFEQD